MTYILCKDGKDFDGCNLYDKNGNIVIETKQKDLIDTSLCLPINNLESDLTKQGYIRYGSKGEHCYTILKVSIKEKLR